MMLNNDLPAALRRAAALLYSRGWVRGRYMNNDGVCALGALRLVASEEGYAVRTYEALAASTFREYAAGPGGVFVNELIKFNDGLDYDVDDLGLGDTTREDVATLMLLMAEAAEDEQAMAATVAAAQALTPAQHADLDAMLEPVP